MNFKKVIVGFVLCFFAMASPSIAQQEEAKPWSFVVSPYLYLPNFGGTIHFSLPEREVEEITIKMKPSDYLDDLNMALMLSFEVRRNKVSLLSDLFYFNLNQEAAYVKSIVFPIDNPLPNREPIEVGLDLDAGTSIDLKSSQYTFVGGYQLLEGKHSIIAHGGMRMILIRSTLDWNLSAIISDTESEKVFETSGSTSASSNSYNAVAGVRGAVSLINSEKLKAIYYLDGGLGTANFTWQASGGLSYRMGIVDAKIVYRHISYDHESKAVLDKLSFSGIAFGASLYF